jgi:hypothetical protein
MLKSARKVRTILMMNLLLSNLPIKKELAVKQAPPLSVTIGKRLMLSPAFPLLHTGRASFPASGVPSN